MSNEKKSGLTALQAGDIIDLDGEQSLVWYCNDCRAAVVPLRSARATSGEHGLMFEAGARTANISPNSEVPIIRRLGKNWLNWLSSADNKQQTTKETTKEKHMSKDTKTTKATAAVKAAKSGTSNGSGKKAAAPAPKETAGRLGGFMGHSVTSVIRAMGVLGWNFAETKATFDKQGVDVADNTIRIQLRAGRLELQAPAEIPKKKLEEIRVKVAEPAPKSKDSKAPAKGKKAKASAPEPDEEEEEEEPAPKAKKKKGKKVASAPVKSSKKDEEEELFEEEEEEEELAEA